MKTTACEPATALTRACEGGLTRAICLLLFRLLGPMKMKRNPSGEADAAVDNS